jgi:hypothetical protein
VSQRGKRSQKFWETIRRFFVVLSRAKAGLEIYPPRYPALKGWATFERPLRGLAPHLESRSLLLYHGTTLAGSFDRTTYGAVAQLGERMTGSHEVRGSIPLGSTNFQFTRTLTNGDHAQVVNQSQLR